MTTEEKIDQYRSYFTQKLDEICTLKDILFKKILLVTMLDTLAVIPSPHEKSNKKRFVDFINKFSVWKDKNRISLPQLQLLLEAETCGQLKREVDSRLCKLLREDEILLSNDSECDEILSIANKDEGELIKKATHSVLLYSYRNHLVHEFREPGYGIEFPDEVNPYYHRSQHLRTNSVTWELVYPVGFLKHLCESSLKNLTEYLYEKNINPYDRYTFGSDWSNKR